jgi:hypothetical protein
MTRRAGAAGNQRLLQGVMAAIGVWGGLLALGAALFGYDQTNGEVHFAPSPLRGLIVLTCVSLFLGGWAVLLKRRPR